MNLKCRLIGHDVSDDYTDSGNWICKHCHSHSWYNFKEHRWSKTPLLMIPRAIIIKMKMNIINWRTRNDLPF